MAEDEDPPGKEPPDTDAAFEKAREKEIYKLVRQPEYWEAYKKVTKDAADTRSKANADYEKTYDAQVSKEYVKLVEESTYKKDFKPEGSSDDLWKKAQNIVRHRHELQLTNIDIKENTDQSEIIRQADKAADEEKARWFKDRFDRAASRDFSR